jgi:hypothetical protein
VLLASYLLPFIESTYWNNTSSMLRALLKEGFESTVSERALIILEPIEGSLAQKGISPHFRRSM